MSHKIEVLNRRNFLNFAIAMGMTLGFNRLFPTHARSISTTKTPTTEPESSDLIDLHIQETKLKIGEKNTKVLTVNDAFPGQLVHLREGQTAKIQVTNHLKEDTSIHWHGIILPANMDGVPGVSFAGIKPGKSFTYEFPVKQSGTYWYHSHSGMQEQQGHFGAVIIDPIEPDPFEYDRDYVVLLSDWTFENPHQILANLKKMPTYYNYQRRTIANLSEDWEWKGMRMDPSDIADVTGATYTYLMNGLTSDANWTALFQPGDRVRLRFINASAMTFFDVRIPGLRMTVVQADGQNVQPVIVDEFRIGVAETYDVIIQPKQEEAYTIFAETMDRSGYARGTLAVKQGLSTSIPERRERPLRTMADMGMDHDMLAMNGNSHANHDMSNNSGEVAPNSDDYGVGNAAMPMMVKSRLNEPGIGLENTGTHVLVYNDLKSLKSNNDPRKPERELELHLTGNMERYMWSFDGKKYSEEKQLTFYHGERLHLTFVNDTMMEHPIHLHGMWMELDNGAGEYKPRKHTINIKPAEKLSVEINVDAPGKWAFHCHLLYHMEVGMFRTVAVVDRAAEVSKL